MISVAYPRTHHARLPDSKLRTPHSVADFQEGRVNLKAHVPGIGLVGSILHQGKNPHPRPSGHDMWPPPSPSSRISHHLELDIAAGKRSGEFTQSAFLRLESLDGDISLLAALPGIEMDTHRSSGGELSPVVGLAAGRSGVEHELRDTRPALALHDSLLDAVQVLEEEPLTRQDALHAHRRRGPSSATSPATECDTAESPQIALYSYGRNVTSVQDFPAPVLSTIYNTCLFRPIFSLGEGDETLDI